MKLDMTQILKSLSGEPLNLKNGDEVGEMTLKDAVQMALLNSDAKDGPTKLSDYQILAAIQPDEATLTAKQVARIEELVGKTLPILVVGAVHAVINGDAEEQTPKE